jgi:hypothetical protein
LNRRTSGFFWGKEDAAKLDAATGEHGFLAKVARIGGTHQATDPFNPTRSNRIDIGFHCQRNQRCPSQRVFFGIGALTLSITSEVNSRSIGVVCASSAIR